MKAGEPDGLSKFGASRPAARPGVCTGMQGTFLFWHRFVAGLRKNALGAADATPGADESARQSGPMWIVAIGLIGWLYVAVLMALAEATSPSGSVVGALGTLLLYGVGPLALVLYVLGTPARRRARRLREARADGPQDAPQPAVEASASDPDGGRHAAADTAIPSERIEP